MIKWNDSDATHSFHRDVKYFYSLNLKSCVYSPVAFRVVKNHSYEKMSRIWSLKLAK